MALLEEVAAKLREVLEQADQLTGALLAAGEFASDAVDQVEPAGRGSVNDHEFTDLVGQWTAVTELDIYYFSGDNRADEPVTANSATALDDVLADILANPQPHPTVVYAKDRPTVGPLELPDHQIKFDVDPERQVGAVHAFGPGDFAADPPLNDVDETTAWTARVKGSGGRASSFSDVTLYIDKDTRTEFPQGAVLPLTVLREVLHEFMRTGKRPVCVDWEQTDVF
jgi:hypothetical protein